MTSNLAGFFILITGSAFTLEVRSNFVFCTPLSVSIGGIDFIRRSAAAAAGMIILPEIIPASAMGLNGKKAPSDHIFIRAIGRYS